MTESGIYRKLSDLGYYCKNDDNNAQGSKPKSGTEEVAIFNFLLPKYDSSFVLGDWLSTDERKSTILRYMKNLGLAHHFNGKAQQVGAAECQQENWQAISELIQKLEKRHGADALYENNKENRSRGVVRNNSGSSNSSIQDQHAEFLHMPATRQRALDIKEVESLALDEVAKKMTGRRAASLGRTELAYIVEVHHAQMKDKLAEKQKQVEKQTKRQQCEEEFALEQLKRNIAKLKNTLMVATKAERSPSADSCADKLPNVKKLTEELKALKKQHMAMLMQAGLAEEEIKKKAEVLRQKERAIDHLAKREQAKLTQRNSNGDKVASATTRAAAGSAPTDERYVADERKTKPAKAVLNCPPSEPLKRNDAKISKAVVLNTGATRSESPSTSDDELEERQKEKRPTPRPTAAAARTTIASGAVISKRSQTKKEASETKTNVHESKPRTVGSTAKRREQGEERATTAKPRKVEKLQHDDERLLKKCEKERRAMKEGRRLPRVDEVLKGWGANCLPPQQQHQQHEHHFLDRLHKERRKRVKQMRSDAALKMKERRKSRTTTIGSTDEAAAGIIVVKDTPWAMKRKKKATASSAGKPVRGRLTFADTESEDEDGRRCTQTTTGSNDDDTSLSSSSSSKGEEEEEDDDDDEMGAITEGCDESDGDGEDLVVEMWDDRHGDEGEHQAAGSSDEGEGNIVAPPRDEGISKVSATVVLNVGPAERSDKRSDERRPDEGPHDSVDESDDSEDSEESEPETEVLNLRKARNEWRWQRDRPERERVEGKRRTEKRRSQGRKNEASRKSEKRKEQRELDEVGPTDGEEGLERREHQRAEMKALMAEYLRDLAEPATDLTLRSLEESCAEPPSEEIQQLQALVAVFEARARNRAVQEVALDEDLLRMSLEEKKRALWGDNYHVDNIKWAIAQQQPQAKGGADKAATRRPQLE